MFIHSSNAHGNEKIERDSHVHFNCGSLYSVQQNECVTIMDQYVCSLFSLLCVLVPQNDKRHRSIRVIKQDVRKNRPCLFGRPREVLRR